MPELDIAGHKFVDGVCRLKVRRDEEDHDCARHLVDLLCVALADVGKKDIAHIGDLNQSEYLSIEAYRTRLFEKIINATHAVADGS